jgi:hypothetical protein
LKGKKSPIIRILAVIVLLSLGAFLGSGLIAAITPTLWLTAYTEKTRFQKGERVSITVVLQNIGLWSVRLTQSGLFDFIVYNETGKEISRFIQSLLIPGEWVISLLPTQTITQTLTWSQKEYEENDFYQVPKGTYIIVVLVSFRYTNNKEYSLTTQPIMITIE